MKHALHLHLLIFIVSLSGCNNLSEIGQQPAFTPINQSTDYYAMAAAHEKSANSRRTDASLWHSGPSSLLGDRRAGDLGDLLTVVIEIDDKAEMSNTTNQSRSGSRTMGMPSLLGIPQAIDTVLPSGATMAKAVDLSSNSASTGDGAVRRKEKLTLRVAATVTEVMGNGHLKIQGSQEVRVNYELRELLVTGFVRPEDISRKNEITYDKIASARISYGGRGSISRAQQPKTGQQFLDEILPF